MDKLNIKELDWQPHPVGMGGEIATVGYDNGYSASCLKGGCFYTTGGTYEIAVMKDGELDYTTTITNDVLGYLSEDEANQALKNISELN